MYNAVTLAPKLTSTSSSLALGTITIPLTLLCMHQLVYARIFPNFRLSFPFTDIGERQSESQRDSDGLTLGLELHLDLKILTSP